MLRSPVTSLNTPTAPLAVALRMSVSSCAMTGSGVARKPFAAASARTFTPAGLPGYLNKPVCACGSIRMLVVVVVSGS
jgi:hypothetical protein